MRVTIEYLQEKYGDRQLALLLECNRLFHTHKGTELGMIIKRFTSIIRRHYESIPEISDMERYSREILDIFHFQCPGCDLAEFQMRKKHADQKYTLDNLIFVPKSWTTSTSRVSTACRQLDARTRGGVPGGGFGSWEN